MDVSIIMRAVLIDWLIDVHFQFELTPETIFLTVNLFDRYFQIKKFEVRREKLQLIGITCLLIASKYEEIYPPDSWEYASVTANTYSITEILEMELEILMTLKFKVMTTSAYKLLTARQLGDQAIENMARFLLELCLMGT